MTYTGRKISTGVQLLNAKVMFMTMTDLLPKEKKTSCVIFALIAHLKKKLEKLTFYELQFVKASLGGE